MRSNYYALYAILLAGNFFVNRQGYFGIVNGHFSRQNVKRDTEKVPFDKCYIQTSLIFECIIQMAKSSESPEAVSTAGWSYSLFKEIDPLSITKIFHSSK